MIVAYEDSLSWGYGAEIAAAIADECFAWLDAPVKRVASTDTFVGYAPQLEDAILPQVETFVPAYLRDRRILTPGGRFRGDAWGGRPSAGPLCFRPGRAPWAPGLGLCDPRS